MKNSKSAFTLAEVLITLGIMTGTTLVTIGGLVDRVKHPKLFKGTMLAGLLTSLYGTWAFVRPFILKDAKGVATK